MAAAFPSCGVACVLQYGVSPYHNNTDKNWITVKDSTWTDIIQPLAKTLSKDKSAIRNCRPGAPPAALLPSRVTP
jgi:hypothetical protein